MVGLTLGASRRQRARHGLPYVPEEIQGMLLNPDAAAPWRGRTWVTFAGDGKAAKYKRELCARVFHHWKWCNLVRHQKSAVHTRGVLRMLGVDGKNLTHAPGAPSAATFASVWKCLRGGSAPRQGHESAGHRHKVWRMLCCLAEAMYAVGRAFLKQTPGETVVAIHRDEKDGRLQVDFTASNRQLHVRAGTMGIVDNKGGTFGIVQSTKQIFEQFWADMSEHFGAIGCKQFRMDVELVNTDAAADEVAASREQSMPSLPHVHAALTPHVKVVARDRAHGAPRQGHLVDVFCRQHYCSTGC